MLKPDLKDGMNCGLHRKLGWPIAKLVYALAFTIFWIIVGTLCFGYLEDGGMERYSPGHSHDFESMMVTLRTVSKLQGLSEDQRQQLINAATFMKKNKPAAIVWGPEGGFFFSVLSLTTIGYGRFLVPRTMGGRLFVIPYTLIGMPVIGILYTVLAKVSLRSVRRLVQSQGRRASKLQTTVIATTLLWLFLFVGAPAIFMACEHWEYYESVYFVYVTVSTIGYGDFVPETPLGICMGILMLPIGLGLVALALASVAQWFEDMFMYFDYNEDSYQMDKSDQALAGHAAPQYASTHDSKVMTPRVGDTEEYVIEREMDDAEEHDSDGDDTASTYLLGKHEDEHDGSHQDEYKLGEE